jgi:hypothetical protein
MIHDIDHALAGSYSMSNWQNALPMILQVM